MTPKPPNGGCKDVVSEICFNHRNFSVPLLSPLTPSPFGEGWGEVGVWGVRSKMYH